MHSKKENIQLWIQSAESDWAVVQSLYEAEHFIHCLFFSHLVLEKLCKAHWVKDNEENVPPKTHNLVVLIQNTYLQLGEDEVVFLKAMNEFQIEGRYPDFSRTEENNLSKEQTDTILEQVKTFKLWLLNKLQ